MGATATIISRRFIPDGATEGSFVTEVQRLRERMAYWFKATDQELQDAYRRLHSTLEKLSGDEYTTAVQTGLISAPDIDTDA